MVELLDITKKGVVGLKSRILASVSTALLALTSTCTLTTFAGTTQTQNYTVQSGDTLYNLSVRNHISLSAMEAANPQIHNFYNLYPGENIHLPVHATPVSTPTSTSTSSASKAQAIISKAKSFLGLRYVWGGTTPKGFDCSGFVQYVYRQNGIALPRQSHDQASVGTPVAKSALKPGDLLFFTNTDQYGHLYANHVTHVGIYIGNDSMIESSSAHNNQGVVIVKNVFSSHYYSSHYYGARNVIG